MVWGGCGVTARKRNTCWAETGSIRWRQGKTKNLLIPSGSQRELRCVCVEYILVNVVSWLNIVPWKACLSQPVSVFITQIHTDIPSNAGILTSVKFSRNAMYFANTHFTLKCLWNMDETLWKGAMGEKRPRGKKRMEWGGRLVLQWRIREAKYAGEQDDTMMSSTGSQQNDC